MPTSVLIIKLAALGDVVMALPMVTAIRAKDPAARITWMCGRSTADLVNRVDGIAETIIVNEAAMLAGTPMAKISAVFGTWCRTFLRRFDAIYIAHTDLRYRLLTWTMLAAHTRALHPERRNRGIVPGRTFSDEYIRLVTARDDSTARSYPVPGVTLQVNERLEERIRRCNPERRPLVALTPGGARNIARENPLRRWPLREYAELARRLVNQGFRVVLTGNRTDGWVRSAFWSIDVLDLIGATDVPALAAVLRECDVVVAHDSGPLHLARLVGTPVVALLGPTPPWMFFRPEPKTVSLWPAASLSCAPCYDGTNFASCSDNICMQMIPCDEVLERVCELVSVGQGAVRIEQPASPRQTTVELVRSDHHSPR